MSIFDVGYTALIEDLEQRGLLTKLLLSRLVNLVGRLRLIPKGDVIIGVQSLVRVAWAGLVVDRFMGNPIRMVYALADKVDLGHLIHGVSFGWVGLSRNVYRSNRT